jgi:hypothetical protein
MRWVSAGIPSGGARSSLPRSLVSVFTVNVLDRYPEGILQRSYPPTMDGDRRYKQRGYMESDRDRQSGPGREDRPRYSGLRPPIDVTGPRLPRMVQSVVASRCYNCSTALPPDSDFKGICPRCNVALHCCKQCAHFEPSTRFQCLKPILARLVSKDQGNECEFFGPRVTVARDAAPASSAASLPIVTEIRRPSAARAAFDNLFKK